MNPIKITSVNFEHTSTCVPSPNQLLIARKASGDYCKLSKKWGLYFCQSCDTIRVYALRAMLRPAFPNLKSISALEIFNVKVRTQLHAAKLEESGALTNHQNLLSSIFKGLDDEDSDVIDDASRHIHSILCAVLNSSVLGWKLLNMLKKMNEPLIYLPSCGR